MSRMSHARGVLAVAVVAAGFLSAPAVAGLAGVSPTSADGRRLAAAPSPSQGWQALPAADAWAKDHLPLRNQAIQAQGRVLSEGLGVLSATAASSVIAAVSKPGSVASEFAIPGNDGYIFYGDDFPRACAARGRATAQLQSLDRLAQMLRARGKRVVLTVAPDKSSVMSGALRRDTPSLACFRQGDAQIRAAVARVVATRPGWVNLFPTLDAMARTGPQPYWRRDTHWAPAGAAAYARAMAAAIDPRLAGRTALHPMTATKVGDSGRLLGITSSERIATRVLTMPGGRVTRTWTVPKSSVALYPEDAEARSTATGPVWRGRTVIIGDSYTKWAMDSLRPLFANLTFVHQAHSPAATSVAALARADTVIIQVVERHLANTALPLQSPGFLDLVRRGVR